MDHNEWTVATVMATAAAAAVNPTPRTSDSTPRTMDLADDALPMTPFSVMLLFPPVISPLPRDVILANTPRITPPRTPLRTP